MWGASGVTARRMASLMNVSWVEEEEVLRGPITESWAQGK